MLEEVIVVDHNVVGTVRGSFLGQLKGAAVRRNGIRCEQVLGCADRERKMSCARPYQPLLRVLSIAVREQ